MPYGMISICSVRALSIANKYPWGKEPESALQKNRLAYIYIIFNNKAGLFSEFMLFIQAFL